MRSVLSDVDPRCRSVRTVDLRGIRLIDSFHPPGLELDRHCHPQVTITLMLEGAFDQVVENQSFSCEPSDLIIKPAGARHTNRFRERGARSLILQIEPSWFGDRMIGEPLGDVLRIHSGLAQAMAFRLLDEFVLADDVTSGAVEEVLFELLHAVTLRRLAPGSAVPFAHIGRAREFIHASFRHSVGLAEVSAEVDLHPVYLARIFRRALGVSVGTYVRLLRLDAAVTRMDDDDVGITRAAIEAGFADHAHFTRTFGKVVGFAPSAFRRRVKKVRSVQASYPPEVGA